MSDISSTLKLSLSQIIDESVVRNLEAHNLFDTALNNESLVSIQDSDDAASLDQKELLEIISALEAQLETATGPERLAIEDAIRAIGVAVDSADSVQEQAVDKEQKVDLDGDGEAEKLGVYLDDPENQKVLLRQFQDYSEDTTLQADILRHYFNNNDFDFMKQLLGTLKPEEASHLIAEVAGNE